MGNRANRRKNQKHIIREHAQAHLRKIIIEERIAELNEAKLSGFLNAEDYDVLIQDYDFKLTKIRDRKVELENWFDGLNFKGAQNALTTTLLNRTLKEEQNNKLLSEAMTNAVIK